MVDRGVRSRQAQPAGDAQLLTGQEQLDVARFGREDSAVLGEGGHVVLALLDRVGAVPVLHQEPVHALPAVLPEPGRQHLDIWRRR